MSENTQRITARFLLHAEEDGRADWTAWFRKLRFCRGLTLDTGGNLIQKDLMLHLVKCNLQLFCCCCCFNLVIFSFSSMCIFEKLKWSCILLIRGDSSLTCGVEMHFRCSQVIFCFFLKSLGCAFLEKAEKMLDSYTLKFTKLISLSSP